LQHPLVLHRATVPASGRKAVSHKQQQKPQHRVVRVAAAENLDELSELVAISPIDGRYGSKTKSLRSAFSEYALIKARVTVEIRWLQTLSEIPEVFEVEKFSNEANQFLENYLKNFSPSEAMKVKEVERTTNHDVKAVEYVIKDALKENAELKKALCLQWLLRMLMYR
jgi:adenylosuccinate lyase